MSIQYYYPKYFRVQELVSPAVYEDLGDRSILTMDRGILKTIDAIREFYGKPMIINDWSFGGQFRYRGYRDRTWNGSPYSQHCFGRAVDFDVKGLKASKVRKDIMDNPDHFPYVTAIEKGTTWVHIDCRPTASGTGIQTFNP